MKTLLDIERSVTVVTKPNSENINILREAINSSLPFEKPSLTILKNQLDTGFMDEYDNKYKRVDYSAILEATKKIAGRTVPAFASYDVTGDGECVKEFNVSGISNLQYVKMSTKIKHCAWGVLAGTLLLAIGVSALTFIGSIIYGFSTGNLKTASLWTLVSVLTGIMSLIFTIAVGANEPEAKVIMKHQYSGNMPSEIRELIKGLQVELPWTCRPKFDRILIVEEAYNWKINEEVISQVRDPDPLVIGEKDNVYFLIAKFDVTPLENLIATEYTT